MSCFVVACCFQAPVSFNTLAPASVFADARVNELFFKTTACLRIDQTQCWPPGHPYYQVTRQGLNAMVTRFLAEAKLVNSMTDELTFPAHPRYVGSLMWQCHMGVRS